MNGRGTAVPHFFIFLLRERSKDARKEVAVRTQQRCTERDCCGENAAGVHG